MENQPREQAVSPFTPEQFAQIMDFLHREIDSKKQLDRLVEILVGNLCAQPPHDLRVYLKELGISEEEYDKMTVDDKFDVVQQALQRRPNNTDNQIALLDIIFKERYGWPEGTVNKHGVSAILLAMEHATEYDNPSKPSIWEITKTN
ncbi:MAG: hypothetical protein ABFC77_11965 [Thermoguttaceae bacterium]